MNFRWYTNIFYHATRVIDMIFAAQACPPCEQGEAGGVAR
jgi:hypothetical protein